MVFCIRVYVNNLAVNRIIKIGIAYFYIRNDNYKFGRILLTHQWPEKFLSLFYYILCIPTGQLEILIWI